jgi:hypothetical protein
MDSTLILVGCAGGALPDVIRIIKDRYKTEFPAHLKSANFWMGFILLVLLGGVAAWLGGATGTKEALAFGFGAPEGISRLLASNEPVTRSGGAGELFQTTRRFWSF